MRIFSVSQLIGLDTMVVFLCTVESPVAGTVDVCEITQPDADGSKFENRSYYIGKEIREIDGQFVVIN